MRDIIVTRDVTESAVVQVDSSLSWEEACEEALRLAALPGVEFVVDDESTPGDLYVTSEE